MTSDTQRFPHLPHESWDLFLQDELDPAAAGRLERHLDECEACLAILESEDPSRLFRRLRSAPIDDATWNGFWEDLAPQLGPPAVRVTGSFRRVAGRLAMAAGLAAAIFGGVLLMRAPRDPGGVVAPVPTAAAADEQPCPSAIASLHLTKEECQALFSGPIESADPPEVIVSETVDLRGL